MKTVVARLATVALLGWGASSAAAPPDDIAAYCRASYPQEPLQVRCLALEDAAADAVRLAAAATDRATFNRCLSTSRSWTAMEACLSTAAELPTEPPDPPAGSPVVLGPQIRPATLPPERERPPRPISEADAERHLRGILERVGYPTAQCTKKQYGPGWVSICQ
jgi:hypothetical protein